MFSQPYSYYISCSRVTNSFVRRLEKGTTYLNGNVSNANSRNLYALPECIHKEIVAYIVV